MFSMLWILGRESLDFFFLSNRDFIGFWVLKVFVSFFFFSLSYKFVFNVLDTREKIKVWFLIFLYWIVILLGFESRKCLFHFVLDIREHLDFDMIFLFFFSIWFWIFFAGFLVLKMFISIYFSFLWFINFLDGFCVFWILEQKMFGFWKKKKK